MSDREYQRLRVHETITMCQRIFNVALPITAVLFDDINTADDALGILFQTSSSHLYALFISDGAQTLADVRKRAKAMGLTIDGYYYPKGDAHYFTRAGYKAFQAAYPGRREWSTQEARYFQTLAPYSPALLRVKAIDGEIRRFNKHDRKWHPEYEFHYDNQQKVTA